MQDSRLVCFSIKEKSSFQSISKKELLWERESSDGKYTWFCLGRRNWKEGSKS